MQGRSQALAFYLESNGKPRNNGKAQGKGYQLRPDETRWADLSWLQVITQRCAWILEFGR